MARALDALQLLFDPRDALRNDATVGLDLGFTRPTEKSKTAALAFEMSPRAYQAAALIGQMRKLDLQRSFARAGALPKYFKNETGAVEHLGVPGLFQIALLHWRQRAIHHHQSGIEALHHAGEFVDFAFSDERRRMNFAERRHPRLDHVKLDRPGETDGLIEPCS